MTIHQNSNRLKALVWLSVFAALLLTISAVIISGCTETLNGSLNENLPPVVYFVNIPPDSISFSYNPEVYWFGSDADGQIDYYRYLVATVEEIGSANDAVAREWAADRHDTVWTYVDVDSKALDPQTAHSITLTANMEHPVDSLVEQFVFLQAFDDDNAGSLIACKRLFRNDNPPDTRIISAIKDDTPYVNAATLGGIVTGVKMAWEGSDVRDYDEQGLVAPPFEYEWRLYGPYTSADSAGIFQIDKLMKTVFVTSDAKIYQVGDTVTFYDSQLIQDENDSIYWEVDSTTVIFHDSLVSNTSLGYTKDRLLDIDSGATTWFNDYHLVARSWDGVDTWVWDVADTMYNVFGKDTTSADSTVIRYFIFWVRSRDDASVADLTPAFAIFPVVDPKYERDILVCDFTAGSLPGYGCLDTLLKINLRKAIFHDLITAWIETRDEPIEFDTSGLYADYLRGGTYDTKPLPVERLLKYKTIIVYSDDPIKSKLMGVGGIAHKRLFTAIDAGINCWATQRGLLVGSSSFFALPINSVPPEISRYFGVEGVFYSSWRYFLSLGGYTDSLTVRMEDFIGAASLDENVWPSINVDKELLRTRMQWFPTEPNVASPKCPYIDSIAAIPEVDWCMRKYGTEVMYLYKSRYGANHFLGYPWTIEGAPIGHRYETNMFRTAWLQFTPACMEKDKMQQLANSLLDWLYDPTLGPTTVSAKRYPDAAVKISIDEARQLFDERTPDILE